MTRLRRTAAVAYAIAVAILFAQTGRSASAAAVSKAQRQTHPQGVTVDSFWLSVANLDRSVRFYRDVLGMPVQSAASSANALLQGLTATPGAHVRGVTLRASSGPSLQLLEFAGVRQRTLHPHSVDPGAAILEVNVPDLSRVLSAAARAHTPIVSADGAPVPLPDGQRGIVLLDPDGFFVALLQSSPAPAMRAPPTRPSLQLLLTVAAPATMERFYRQVFGITLQASRFGSLGPWAPLLNQRTAQWAITQTRPATPAAAPELHEVQFVSFRRVARHTFNGRPQDPGTPTLSLRVTNMSAALRAIRSAGLRVLSAGGQPVPMSGGGSGVVFRDPAGVLVGLVQR